MLSRSALALAALLLGPDLAAEPINGRGVVVCGLFEVQECVADHACERVRPHEVGIHSRFLSVDFRKKELYAASSGRKTVVSEIREIGNKLVLTGAESGRNVDESGVGFSLTITKDNGHMSLAVTGDQVAFVVFGACTAE